MPSSIFPLTLLHESTMAPTVLSLFSDLHMSRHISIFKPLLLTNDPLLSRPATNEVFLHFQITPQIPVPPCSPAWHSPVLLQPLTVELGIKDLGSLKQTKTMYNDIEIGLQGISLRQEDHLSSLSFALGAPTSLTFSLCISASG